MRFIAYGLLYYASFINSIAIAQTPDPCHILFESACTGGNRNDGTGITIDGVDLKKVFESVSAKVEREMKPEISARLSSDKAYRTLAYSAFGHQIKLLPCRIVSSSSKSCISKLAESVAEYMVNGPTKSLVQVGVEAKYYLIISPTTEALKQSAEKRLNAYMNYDKKSAEVVTMIKDIKAIMVRRVERYVEDPKKRKLLIDHINGIVNDLNKEGACDGKQLSSHIAPTVFYHPLPPSITVCSGVHLYSTSAYFLSFAIAHEIAHSIGPSGYALLASENSGITSGTREEYENAHPYGKAIQCLRKVPKAGAKILSTSLEEYEKSTAKLSPETYYFLAAHTDEINETFSDWLGADIASELMEQTHPQATVQQRRSGYSNVARFFCGPIPPDDSHRSGYRRSLTVATNPRVRKQMGCTDKPSPAASCGAGQIDDSASGSKAGGGVK